MASSTAASQAAPASAPAASSKAVVLGPFRGGTQPTIRSAGYSKTLTMAAATQDFTVFEVAPTNILRCIYVTVTAVAAGNSASVAFQPDAPLNILSTFNFADSGGTAIVGPFDSFTLSMGLKYFGYSAAGDPRNNAVYSVTTGTGATGGSFNVTFRVPVEAVARTGVGSLQNQTTQSPFTVSMTLNTLAAVYSTAPTAAPAVTVSIRLGGYWNGSNAGFQAAPNAFGSTQYINRASIMALNGAADTQLPNNGLGNPVRNLMLINYLTGGARSSTAFPDPFNLSFRGNTLVAYTQNLWRFDMSEAFGLTGAIDTGTGLDTGVFTIPFNRDFGLLPGAELGIGYLDTELGDELRYQGTWNASSTMYELVNFIAVKDAASGNSGAVSQIQGLT